MSRCREGNLRPAETILPLLALAVLTAPVQAVDGPPLMVGLVAGTDPWSASLAAGAEDAATALNLRGGLHGRPLHIRVLPAATPWRQGPSAIARLAADGDTVALIGAPAGSQAHVAAQVASRLRLPLLTVSPAAGPTQAGTGWVFRMVDDDRAQALALLTRLAADMSRHAILIVPEGRDGREREAALRQACDVHHVAVRQVLRVGRQIPPVPDAADIVFLWLDALPARALLDAWGTLPAASLLGSTRLRHPSFINQRNWPVRIPGTGTDLPYQLGQDMVHVLAAADAPRGGASVRRSLASGAAFAGQSDVFIFDASGNRAATPPADAASAER